MDKRDIKIFVKCDYCGAENYIRIGSYNKNKERNNGKYFCLKCLRERESKMYMEKYGVDNALSIPEVREKIKNTNMDRYGVEYPTQSKTIREKAAETVRKQYGVEYICIADSVREKAKQTVIEKYGVDNVLKNKEIYGKALKTRLSNLENEYTPSSKNQKHIVELYNGILNYQIDSYFVDGLLENNVFFEYDGSGHDLSMRIRGISKEEFENREFIRSKYLISKGYKEFRIISYDDKIPDDNKLLEIKNSAFRFLIECGYESYKYYVKNDVVELN